MLWARYWPTPPDGPNYPPGQIGALNSDAGISGLGRNCNRNDAGREIWWNRDNYQQDNNYWGVVIAAWPSKMTSGSSTVIERGVKNVKITRTCHQYRERGPCNGPCAGGWVKLWPNTYLHKFNDNVELRNEYPVWGRKWHAEKMFDMGRRRGAVICGYETANAIGKIVDAQAKAVSEPLTG